jgi:flavin-dependent dehydrogenase
MKFSEAPEENLMRDLPARIAALPPEKRALLEQWLQEKGMPAVLQSQRPHNSSHQQYDLVILGGGLAGLTLARQLKRARPETSILVAEKREHPVPEAAHKVGEATVEMGAHYFSEVLGMKEHLQADQLRKAGLRLFFSAGDNRDIARRVEVGTSFFLPVASYQLDRGRFENTLGRENLKLGVEFLDACKVKEVSLSRDQHSVTLLRDEREFSLIARWVVDASGRACLLKRRLGLVKKNSHDVNAVWFRIGESIDLDDWSEDPVWRARTPPGFRKLSTNHLMGRGYWVWLIPLASGSTSIGIVADPALHPFDEINRFDRVMEWLRKHEPQCAKVIDEKCDQLQDFCVLRHYSHSCERVFSADHWCITGEAGVFLDPFYSPGSDFIALSNSFITELILGDLRGEEIKERVEIYNGLYLAGFERFLPVFERQYPLMGNAQVMTAKVVWDFASYWGVTALLYFHNKWWDLNFKSSVGRDLWRFNLLNVWMQAFFREWDQLDQRQLCDAFVDYGKLDFLYKLQGGLTAGLNDNELKAKISENIDLLETLATEVSRKAAQLLPVFFKKDDLNPYAMSLKPERWEADDLFSTLARTSTTSDVTACLNKIWFDSKVSVEE